MGERLTVTREVGAVGEQLGDTVGGGSLSGGGLRGCGRTTTGKGWGRWDAEECPGEAGRSKGTQLLSSVGSGVDREM